AKTNWLVNSENRIYLSFYTGRDAYSMEDGGSHYKDYVRFGYSWQNLTSVLRWNHIFSPGLFANFSVYNSRFRQMYLNKFDKKGSEMYKGYNNLNDWTAKGDFDWFPASGPTFRFGYELSVQQFSPEIISYRSDSTSFKLNKDVFTRNFITDVYAEGEVNLTKQATGTLGLRAGNLATRGKNYLSLRPRISVRYLFAEQISGKISWSRMKQFLHQLQNTTLGIPTELWVSSTAQIPPGTSDLFSAGVFLNSGGYQFSTETFYTALRNVIQYREGTLAVKERGESWEKHVVQGSGESYGMELMAEKTTGALTGWIAYTLSKSTRQFDEINGGRTFPYTYERRHQLNINTNWFLGEKQKKDKIIKKDFSTTFSYASGKYITLAKQEYQAISLPLMEGSRYNAEWFSRRSLINSVNNYQMPDFHHLNLSYRIERQNAGKINSWNFSVYNVYNRLNPWYYYKKGSQMKQITLFPLIPSVSYTYRW
ncbi:MAG TPA: TonB-dependent receptor, partial [Prolixibacteraceae bacterium]|nr:TonB-dependent receptor [Prolixibacteraceae bacterium]